MGMRTRGLRRHALRHGHPAPPPRPRPLYVREYPGVILVVLEGQNDREVACCVRVEPGAKRVRAYLNGELVADTRRPFLVWERPYYPTYYLPASDVRAAVTAKEAGTGAATTTATRGRIRSARRPAEMMNFGRPDARRPVRRHDGGTAATTRVRASHPADVPVARTRAHDDPRNARHRPVGPRRGVGQAQPHP